MTEQTFLQRLEAALELDTPPTGPESVSTEQREKDILTKIAALSKEKSASWWQNSVRDFHHAMEQAAPRKPTLENYPFELRARLILEEAHEFVEACGLANTPQGLLPRLEPSMNNNPIKALPDWEDMIDALCDILYVTFGAAVAMGVDLEVFYAEVQRSNMAKVGGPVRTDGKRMKPPGWTPPDIAGLLYRLRKAEVTE